MDFWSYFFCHGTHVGLLIYPALVQEGSPRAFPHSTTSPSICSPLLCHGPCWHVGGGMGTNLRRPVPCLCLSTQTMLSLVNIGRGSEYFSTTPNPARFTINVQILTQKLHVCIQEFISLKSKTSHQIKTEDRNK